MNYLDHVIAFIRDVLLQPVWVQLWFLWMVIVVIVTPLPLLWRRTTRQDGLVATASALFLAMLMPFWHAKVGYTRILGLPHFLGWIPLLAWLYWRRTHLTAPVYVRWAVLLLVATTVVSLGFDGTDAVRYVLGERTPIGG